MNPNDELTNSIFQKTWWLDAVAAGTWKFIEIEKGGEVFARMPVVFRKKFGILFCTMPMFTQVLGPWIKPHDGKLASRLSSEKELLTEIINQLPKFHIFKQRFHYSVTNWLPFFWNSFNQTTRYTYVLEDISDTDKTWNDMQGNIRREIKKAKKNITIEQVNNPELMWEYHCLNFQNGIAPEGSLEDFKKVNKACLEHNAGQMFIARNENKEIISAMYIVWDENSAYYLFGGTIPEHKNTGAFSLMMFEAIKFAGEKTNTFDFEGSMIESIERFYRSFGGVPKPYFHVTKENGFFSLLYSIKRALLS